MYRMPLVVLCSILLAACSDDGGNTTPDTTGGPDGTVVDGTLPFPDGATPNPDGPQHDGPLGDQGTPVDGAPQGDGTKLLNCPEVSTCSDTCAAACGTNLACMMACPTDCNAKGCASAQPLFTAVNSCVTSQCFLQCMGGPTPSCKTCVSSKCASQVAACNAHTC